MIFMLVLILFAFIVAAVYSGSAAGKTGGGKADQANKNAHSNYVNSTIIGWIVTAAVVLSICIAIYLGAEAAAAAKAVSVQETAPVKVETKTITNAQVMHELSLPVADTPETQALNKNIEKKAKSKGFFERLSDNQKSSAKGIRIFLYLSLFTFIVLAILAGTYAAIGSAEQQKSESKEGLKPGTISAIINLFVAGMFIVFFIVMYIKDRAIHKRLKQDIIKHHEFAMEYSKERKAQVTGAKANIAAAYLNKFYSTEKKE